MLKNLRKLITHRYLSLALRLYLGGLFIYASMYKINYPAEFAESIATYELLPYWSVNFMAVVLPWVELICGILLIIGIRSRTATVVIGSLLLMFTLAILINVVKGASISCGCFHAIEDKISWWTVLRDLLWLTMAIQVFFHDKAFHLEKRFALSIKEVQ
jgi:putative oxidoreductase